MKEFKVTDYITNFLYSQGVRHVFVVIGGMITHLVDSLNRKGKIQTINVHHEQAAAFAAEGSARVTGVPGIALATSGPGATNLLTGIGSCYFDSTPAIFITGQVNTNEQKGDKQVRQLGFQETDIVDMAKPITKAAWRIKSPEEVPMLLEKAFVLALSGRPGPVLLDIPMNVQGAKTFAKVPTKICKVKIEKINHQAINDLIADLRLAQRPLILAGGGIRSARVADQFKKFVEKIKIPVVNSLMMVDALPYNNPLRVGMIGTYGNRWANLSIGCSDLILVIGSRLDIRQTGSDTIAFKGNRKIYHLDCEEGEVNNRVTGCIPIIGHLRSFFTEVMQKLSNLNFPDRPGWLAEISKFRSAWPDTVELHGTSGINPNELMHLLSSKSGKAAAFVVDVGNHQMWAAQSLEISPGQNFITSGGMGAMGYALPAGIGVAMAKPERPVVVIAGDGGLQINIQELETVVHNKLPIKIVVLNNRSYGMVRQFQQSYFCERYYSTYWGYSAPDFSSVARAYGINSSTVDYSDSVSAALEELWRDPKSPFLLQVMIDTATNVYPKIAFGLPLTEMEPFAKPIDMEGT